MFLWDGWDAKLLSLSRAAGHLVHFVVQKSAGIGWVGEGGGEGVRRRKLTCCGVDHIVSRKEEKDGELQPRSNPTLQLKAKMLGNRITNHLCSRNNIMRR